MEGLIHNMTIEEFRVVKALRTFFDQESFDEVYMQNRLGIMPACEDPENVTSMIYMGEVWPLPQTNQMWLEDELLKNKTTQAIHTLTTSYRQEVSPIVGRHKVIFPLYEFESKGEFEDLQNLMDNLMKHFGFPLPEGMDRYPRVTYEEACKKYGVSILEREHEALLEKDFGPVVLLVKFPMRSDPFWNMKLVHDDGETYLTKEQITHPDRLSYKMDVIVGGMEVCGTGERSSDSREMKIMFDNIVGGDYARNLQFKFTKKRVSDELEKFVSHDFVPRFGGGIGIDRLISALRKYNLYDQIVS